VDVWENTLQYVATKFEIGIPNTTISATSGKSVAACGS